VVGADRITQDAVFNKIGTYSVAVLAHEHGIPFYVAAPKSTFDLTCKAADVTVEERKPDEITHVGCQQTAPDGVPVYNPAFDATPLKYVSAIICESRVIHSSDFGDFRKGKI
jgi:methylthioribose-1-phosphate isomerase